jgi:hypothetical protein
LLLRACLRAVLIASYRDIEGYQKYGNALGTVQIKVKGAVSTGSEADGSFTIFDANDVVVPAQEHDALFVMTKYELWLQRAEVCLIFFFLF